MPRLRVLLLLACLAAVSACSGSRPPEPLIELRGVVESAAFESGDEAAPDVAAEAERSLAMAEQAFARGDEARARRMATLGGIQARIAMALLRQQAAGARSERARGELRGANEDVARYRSRREDADNEIRRLESIGREP